MEVNSHRWIMLAELKVDAGGLVDSESKKNDPKMDAGAICYIHITLLIQTH